MKRKFFILLFLLASIAGFAQKPKHYEALAQESEKVNDNTGAAYYYKKAFELDSNRLDIYLNYANALWRDNNYKQAEFAFEYFYYHPLREGNEETLFYLALNQQYNGRYKQAAKNFRDFQKFEGNEHPLFEEAKQREKSCEYAIVNEDDLNYFLVEHLDRSINTIHSEFAPYLAEDSIITFAALKYQAYDYANRLPENNFESGIRIWKGEVTKNNSSTLLDSLRQSEFRHWANFERYAPNKAFVTICLDDEHCGINKITLKGDSVLKIEELPKTINAPQSINTHPRLVIIKQDTFLLFASNRNGGFGGFDIWFAKYSNNNFEEPQNIGQRINSKGNEVTPFFHVDSNYIYFSSDWHEGYGGYDVFRVKGTLEDHSFPENAGSEINSSANDLYFNYSIGKQYGTFVSNRKGSISVRGETCCNDIYFFKHAVEEPTVEDTTEFVLAEKKDTVKSKTVEPEIPEEISTTFAVYFPNDQPKPLKESSIAALPYQDIFSIYNNQKTEHEAIDSSNHFFEVMLASSYQKLEKMKATIANSNDTLYLNLRGFASPLATEIYNKALATRRIDAIIKYFEIPDGKNVVINTQPIGERKNLPDFLSNDSNKKSIFSLPAMRERKVEISLTNKLIE